MAKDDGNKKDFDDIPHERQGPRPDFSIPPPRKALPKELQDTLDNEEKMWETMYDGSASDSTDTNLRYAAYASRLRTVMMSAHRYVAYTSDIGESFRPVAHPYWIRTAYGISWLYLSGDVAHEGYKAYVRNQAILSPEKTVPLPETPNTTVGALKESVKGWTDKLTSTVGVKTGDDAKTGSVLTGGEIVPGRIPAIEDYRAVMAQRAVFQGLASMGLPAFTIHSVVRYSGRAMKDVKNKTIRTWGPIGLGLAVVPFLPYLFDEPVEHATEWVFYNGFKFFGGAQAVEGRPVTGQKELREEESHVKGSGHREL
ncbi:hypothetical protein P280DRAFT_408423 [Massarina eburnea CBS 473.64]|uniref:Mitochondrial fission process protein 1 n=1 Tax=Massarina eburnea CBS 473.64 TaxID=1395130 RepID=A0A6A6RN55_9PLEO|nr:hypothetical protein P280DRAFT_408423 [Massarina eburnea CBS 473.64]